MILLMSRTKIYAALFVNVSKAFDFVDHEFLLQRLSTIRMRGIVLKLLRNYLTGPTQSVSTDGFKWELLKMSKGVPQGSTLAPMLFSIVIQKILGKS